MRARVQKNISELAVLLFPKPMDVPDSLSGLTIATSPIT